MPDTPDATLPLSPPADFRLRHYFAADCCHAADAETYSAYISLLYAEERATTFFMLIHVACRAMPLMPPFHIRC